MESDETCEEGQPLFPEPASNKSVAELNESSAHLIQTTSVEDEYPPIEAMPDELVADLLETPGFLLEILSDKRGLSPDDASDTSAAIPPEITTPRLKVVIESTISASSNATIYPDLLNPTTISTRIDYQALSLLTDSLQDFEDLAFSTARVADDIAKAIWNDIEVKLQLIRNRLEPSAETEDMCAFLVAFRIRASEKQLGMQDLDMLQAKIIPLNYLRYLAVRRWKITIAKRLEQHDQHDALIEITRDLLDRLNDQQSIEAWQSVLNVATQNLQEIKRRKLQEASVSSHRRGTEEGITKAITQICKNVVMDDMLVIKGLILENGDEFNIFNSLIRLFYKIYAIYCLVSLLFSPSKCPLILPHMRSDFLYYFIELFGESARIDMKTFHEKAKKLKAFAEICIKGLEKSIETGAMFSHSQEKIFSELDINNRIIEDFQVDLYSSLSLYPHDKKIDTYLPSDQIYAEMPSATRQKYEGLYNKLLEAYFELIRQSDVDSFISRTKLAEALRQIIQHIRRHAEGTAPDASLYASMLYAESKPLSTWVLEKRRGQPKEPQLMESLLEAYVPVIERFLLEPSPLSLSIDSELSVGSGLSTSHDASHGTHQRHTMPELTVTSSSSSRPRGPRSLSLFELSLHAGAAPSSSSSSAPGSPLSPRQLQLSEPQQEQPLSPRGVFKSTTYRDVRPSPPPPMPGSPRTSWLESLKRGTHSNSSPSLPTVSPRNRARIDSGSLSPRAGTPPPSPRPKPSISSLFIEMVDEFRRHIEPSGDGSSPGSPGTTPR